MITRCKIESYTFKCRGLFWAAFAVLTLILPSSYSVYRLVVGGTILVLGQVLRFIAAGYIPSYRTEKIGAPELITWGVYRYVRNPLYLGNFLMGLGWSLLLSFRLCFLFSVAFVILYGIIIPAEERFLMDKFGERYEEYKNNVPAFFPFTFRNGKMKNSKARPFNPSASVKGEVYSLLINIPVTLLILIKLFKF